MTTVMNGASHKRAHRRVRPRLLPGEALKILASWLEKNPGTHTLLDMELGTGLPKSTVRAAVLALGVAPLPGRVGRRPSLPMAPAVGGEVEADGENRPQLHYLSKLQDGTLVGIDPAGQLWTLVPGRLL